MMVDMNITGVWTDMESNSNRNTDSCTSSGQGCSSQDNDHKTKSKASIPTTNVDEESRLQDSVTTTVDDESRLQDSITKTERENEDRFNEVQDYLYGASGVTRNTYQEKLRQNFNFLVKELTPVDIIPSMITHRLGATQDSIVGINKNDNQSLIRILADLLDRGEDGYRRFLKCLQESDYHEVLRKLEPDESHVEYGFCRGKMPEPGYSKIRRNLEELQSGIYPPDILQWLFAHDVISEDDCKILWKICDTGCREKCMIELLHKLLNRGPLSYKKFLLCLEVKGYRDLVKRLEPQSEVHEVDVEYPGGGYDFNHSPDSRQNNVYVMNKEKMMVKFLGDEENILSAVSNVEKACVKVTFRILVLDKSKTSSEDLEKRLREGVGSGNIGGDEVKTEGFRFQTISDDSDLGSEEAKRVDIENNKSELRIKEKLLQEEQEELDMILEILKERKGSKESVRELSEEVLLDKVYSDPELSSASVGGFVVPESSIVSQTDKKQIINRFILNETWFGIGEKLEKLEKVPVEVNITNNRLFYKILTVTGEKRDIDQFIKSSFFILEEIVLKVVEVEGLFSQSLMFYLLMHHPIVKVIIRGQGKDKLTKIYLRGPSFEINKFIDGIKAEGREFKIFSELYEDFISEGKELSKEEEKTLKKKEGYVKIRRMEMLYEIMEKYSVNITFNKFYPYLKICIVGQDNDVEEIFKVMDIKVDVVTEQIKMDIKQIELLHRVHDIVHVEMIKNPSTELIFVNLTGDRKEVEKVSDRLNMLTTRYKSVSYPFIHHRKYDGSSDEPRKYDSTKDQLGLGFSSTSAMYDSIGGQVKVRGRHLHEDYDSSMSTSKPFK